ncbi:MAG: PKD domain-containing protein, partial [Candidatus Thermoplasmatota archaeon]|nr:PKD domain-containing protein [Candidatus Thermoplasmatota archaeon]
ARSKVTGILLMLTLALAGLFVVPAGASAEGMANLKVVVRDNLLGTIDDAAVYCVNVHTGARYDLEWDQGNLRYEADVSPGSYQIYASAEGFNPQSSPKMVYKLTADNDDNVQQIRLNIIGADAMARVHVTFNGNDVEDAKVHLFGSDGIHLMGATTPKGYANISGPQDEELHMIVMSKGKVTYSDVFTLIGTMDLNVTLAARPAVLEDSFMVIGLVMNGSVNIPDVEVTIWDQNFGHMVPVDEGFEGAISLPLYSSVFDVIIEAKGYEPMLVRNIDLEGATYYTPEGETFEMAKIMTKSGKVTTVNLAADVTKPFISTVWTLDANSRLFGTLNDFGTPRMQIAGTPFSGDWLIADETEVNDARMEIKKAGPVYLTTESFLKVNSKFYAAEDESFIVETQGLEGDSSETGVNPVITMTTPYSSELEFKVGKDDIRLEIFSILEGEVVDITLPAQYEILGDFGDKAEFIDDNTSKLRVFEPLEFNAKVEKAPDAVLGFVNSYDFYRVEPKKFIVKLNENITLTGKNSLDTVGSIDSYLWGDLPDNIKVWDEENEMFVAKADVDLTEMKEITFQFTAHKDGYHNITLQVQDTSMLKSNVDWLLLMPDGQAPTLDSYTLIFKETKENVTMDGEKYAADEDLIIIFNASLADDGEGEIVDWVWTFSDGTKSLNGDVVEHPFSDPGEFNVTLRVVDAVGNELELLNSSTVVVSDKTKPMAVIKPFPDVKQGDVVEMNATQSYDPRTTGNLKEEIVAWKWYVRPEDKNWTVQEEIGDEQVFNYTFERPGTYIINMSVEDKSGLVGWAEKILLVSGPDLQVKSITFTNPEENDLKKGERAKVSIAYSNEGTVEVNDTWTIRISLDGDGKIKEEMITAKIEPGKTQYFNFSFELKKKGEHTISVYVDFNGDIAEMNEDNNKLETQITIKESEGWFEWWYLLIVLAVILVGYVVYMKYTRSEWGYEPIQRWWEKRNA